MSWSSTPVRTTWSSAVRARGGRERQGAQRRGDPLGGATGGVLPPKQGDRDGPGARRSMSPTAQEERQTAGRHYEIRQSEEQGRTAETRTQTERHERFH